MNSPITGKPMKIQNEMFEIPYLGKIVPYLHTCWYCEDSGETFTTTEIDEEHMERIKRKYELLNRL
jgi:C4-type Zn-finger protein